MPWNKEKKVFEPNELEQAFLKEIEEVNPLIQAKLKEASKALKEAVQLAEQHGIPFQFGISPIWNSYTPYSFDAKWGDKLNLDRDDYDSMGVWENMPSEYGGWEHSAVC